MSWSLTPSDPLLVLQRAVGYQRMYELLQTQQFIRQPRDRFDIETAHTAEQIMRMPTTPKNFIALQKTAHDFTPNEEEI